MDPNLKKRTWPPTSTALGCRLLRSGTPKVGEAGLKKRKIRNVIAKLELAVARSFHKYSVFNQVFWIIDRVSNECSNEYILHSRVPLNRKVKKDKRGYGWWMVEGKGGGVSSGEIWWTQMFVIGCITYHRCVRKIQFMCSHWMCIRVCLCVYEFVC